MSHVFLFVLMFSLGVGEGIQEVEGGFFVPHQDMSNLIAYVEKIEAENEAYEEFIEEQSVAIEALQVRNEELMSQIGCQCIGWQISFGVVGATLVGVLIYGLMTQD